ncbi:hypothetical protein [Photobacterium rosenbergii]|uniref:Uncharacterized protein n=1 Tax=Photobacterium rosenbergii TaxID=294936 RepID=A0ABU3ZBH1_9GAMM|nr:hypothetical protein [Photobacterium rosenbergii]MDV5167460.1 hypothetical protein [Photobacterium rosenbergii]
MISDTNVLFLLGLLSMHSQANSQLEKAADEICFCLEVPYQQAEKSLRQLNGAQASNDLDKVTRSQDEMMATINASTLCLEYFRQLYPDIAKDVTLHDRTLRLLDTKCPNPLSAQSLPSSTEYSE